MEAFDAVATCCPDYTHAYDPDADFDAWYTRATASRILPWLKPTERVLELGAATGLMTELLLPARITVVGVERSAEYLSRARNRNLPRTEFVEADLLAYAPEGRFDHVLATNLLHGFDDPSFLLRRIRDWLEPAGLLHVTLPNPASLHRLAAVAEGLISDVFAVSDRERLYGTQRAWTIEAFRRLAAGVGYEVVAGGGITLKPYPNATMEQLPESVLRALEAAGDLAPEHAAMHYTVLRRTAAG